MKKLKLRKEVAGYKATGMLIHTRLVGIRIGTTVFENSLAFKKKTLFIYLFIFGCVGSSFLCEGFLQLRRAGAALHRGARASHYRGLSCCGAQAPDAQVQ